MQLFSWHGGRGGVLHFPGAKEKKTAKQKHAVHEAYWWSALFGAVFLFINASLYIYMGYATLPFTSVGGVNVGLQSRAAALETLEAEFIDRTITLSIDGVNKEVDLEKLGVSLDAEATYNNIRAVDGLAELPIFKIFTNPVVDIMPQLKINEARIIALLEPEITEETTEPVSATLNIPYLEKDPIEITPSKNGSEFSAEIAAEQVISILAGYGSAPSLIAVEPRIITPQVHESQLRGTLAAAESLLEAPLIVNDADGEKVTEVSTLTLRNMISTNSDGELTFDEDKLRAYLHEELALYFFEAPVPKRVNGGVVAEPGKDGMMLNLDAAFEVFMDDVLSGADEISLDTTVFEKANIKDGVYPKTDAGLQALIRDFDIEKSGDYRIIVHQLRGGNLRATHKGADSSIPASTYKAFIAYAAMKATEQGEMTLQDQTRHGTVDECMYEMLHVSTDFCAFAIQDYMTWKGVDQKIREANIENTFLANEDRIQEKYTTAQDEFKLYKGLYYGTLLNKFHTNHLLTMLKEQMWRSGIPGGSSPSIVADKVGFYAGWINDVGIVYGDKADYIIIALSDGGSFWEINDLSRRIYNFFEN